MASAPISNGRVRAPGLLPRGAAVLARPHAAARRTDPDLVGVRRVAHEGRTAASDVHRTDHLPFAMREVPQRVVAEPGHVRGSASGDGGVTHGPRSSCPEPAGSRLVMRGRLASGVRRAASAVRRSLRPVRSLVIDVDSLMASCPPVLCGRSAVSAPPSGCGSHGGRVAAAPTAATANTATTAHSADTASGIGLEAGDRLDPGRPQHRHDARTPKIPARTVSTRTLIASRPADPLMRTPTSLRIRIPTIRTRSAAVSDSPADELLERFNLTDDADRPTKTLVSTRDDIQVGSVRQLPGRQSHRLAADFRRPTPTRPGHVPTHQAREDGERGERRAEQGGLRAEAP